jgi:hypothetical protein
MRFRDGRRAQPSTPMGVRLRADAQRLALPFACRCFLLAWARIETARAADIGIAGLFIVGIAVLVNDHDRFAACPAGMMMFRRRGRLDRRRCNQRRADNCDKRLSHFDLRNAGRLFPNSLLPLFGIWAQADNVQDPKPPLIHDAYLIRPQHDMPCGN